MKVVKTLLLPVQNSFIEYIGSAKQSGNFSLSTRLREVYVDKDLPVMKSIEYAGLSDITRMIATRLLETIEKRIRYVHSAFTNHTTLDHIIAECAATVLVVNIENRRHPYEPEGFTKQKTHDVMQSIMMDDSFVSVVVNHFAYWLSFHYPEKINCTPGDWVRFMSNERFINYEEVMPNYWVMHMVDHVNDAFVYNSTRDVNTIIKLVSHAQLNEFPITKVVVK